MNLPPLITVAADVVFVSLLCGFVTTVLSADDDVSLWVLRSALRGDLLGSRKLPLYNSSLISSSCTCSIRGSIAKSVMECLCDLSDDLNLDPERSPPDFDLIVSLKSYCLAVDGL